MSPISRKFATEVRDASIQCMESMAEASPSYGAMVKEIGSLRVSSILYEASEMHARRNMMLIDVSDLLNLTHGLPSSRLVDDGGFPELITETEFCEDSPVLRVVGARNVGKNSLPSGDKIPCLLALKGPQALYATGMFGLMCENNLPDVITGSRHRMRLPQLAVNRDTIEAPLDTARSVASYVEGFVSHITLTPPTGGLDQTALEAGRRNAEKSDFPEAIPLREIVDKAVRFASKGDREAAPMKRAPKSTDVFSMDY